MGVHTLESHLINVNKLCRVCGKRAKKYNDRRETAKDCKYYGKQILYYYGIDTESDNPLTHSTKICEQCYSHFHNYSQEQTVPQHLLTTFSDRVTSSRFLWQIFDENIDEDSCSVCSHCKEQNKGGRPKKAKRGRKARNVQDDVNPSHQESLEFQPNMCSTPQRRQRSSGVSNDLGLGDQKCSQFSCESSPLLLHGDQSSSAVYNPSLTERPVPAHCEMLPASSTSDVHLEQKKDHHQPGFPPPTLIFRRMHLHIKRLSRHRRKEENLTLPRKYLSAKMCQLQMWLVLQLHVAFVHSNQQP